MTDEVRIESFASLNRNGRTYAVVYGKFCVMGFHGTQAEAEAHAHSLREAYQKAEKAKGDESVVD